MKLVPATGVIFFVLANCCQLIHAQPEIASLYLIDADSNAPILEITNGAVIDLESLGRTAPAFNIQATTTEPVGSVRFDFDGEANYRTESVAPYALCGDAKSIFKVCADINVGVHTVSATAFSEKSAAGTAGATVQIAFSIVLSAPPVAVTAAPVVSPVTAAPAVSPVTSAPVVSPATAAPAVSPVTTAPIVNPVTAAPVVSPVTAAPVPSPVASGPYSDSISAFYLIYTPTNERVMELYNGAVVSLEDLALPEALFNVDAVAVETVQSVQFQESARNEGKRPFAYCGDKGGYFSACPDFFDGSTNTVTVTPYAEGGTALPDVSVSFSIQYASATAVDPTDVPISMPTNAPLSIATAIPQSVTAAPVANPVTAAPAVSPVTSAPVVSPATAAPALSPVTTAPIVNPVTAAPVVSPVTAAPVPSPVAPGPYSDSISAFYLIYTPTNERVMELYNGAVVSLEDLALPEALFNVDAVAVETVQSVQFQESARNEGKRPFAYCGDKGGYFSACPDFFDGSTNTVTVTPYAEGGTALPDVSVSFSIQYASATAVDPTDVPISMPTNAPLSIATAIPQGVPTQGPNNAPSVSPSKRPSSPVGTLPTAAAAAFGDPTVQSLISLSDIYPSTFKGKAELEILKGNGNIQKSNYGANAFILKNTGDKSIVACFIDATGAMFSDSVFDSDGTGGDSSAKALTYDSGGITVGAISTDSYTYSWLPARDESFDGSAVFDPTNLSDENNLFVDETANTNYGSPKSGGGFRGELLLFNDFNGGEQCGFSGDMDPNSVAGLAKSTIDSGANWDVGGVSGAELIGSVVSILFADGSTASSTLASDGSNAGGIAVLYEDGLQAAPVLTVNGAGPGGSGTYNGNPAVMLTASGGSTVRVSMAKGFDAVVNNQTVAGGAISINDLVAARLAVQYPAFPVNNVQSWQHREVMIPSDSLLDVSNLFDVGNDNLPIAWSAVIIDGTGNLLSETTDPIHLVYDSSTTASGPPRETPTAMPSVVPLSTPATSVPSDVPSQMPTDKPSTITTESPSKEVTDAPVIVVPPEPFEDLLINCGGPEYTEMAGVRVWQADNYFDGGKTFNGGAKEIDQTQDDVIYWTERTGVFSYAVPVPPGDYEIKLHFAEIFFTDPGKRVFTIIVEDTVFEDIDLFVIGGGSLKAFTFEVPGIVDDGFVNIQTIKQVNNAKLSGIEIIQKEIHTAHAVSQGPYTVVDKDNDGFGLVSVDSSPSHTHGEGMVLTEWRWQEGATLLGTGEVLDLTLPIGEHTVALTVIDSGGNDSTEVTTITVLPFGYPDIEMLSPSKGSVSGGYEVTITGSGFTTSSEIIVHFGLTELTGDDIVVEDANTIKVIAPFETVAIPVQVSVESLPLGVISNSKTFTFETAIPIAWTSKIIVDFPSVTVVAWGPDKKLYAGNSQGQIAKLTLDDDFNLVDGVVTLIDPERAILGMAFDPLTTPDEVDPPVYFSSSDLFHKESQSSSGKAINGKIQRASGSNLDIVEDIVTGLPVADMDHAVNGIVFGDQGEIYFQIGSNTNGGIPGPLTGSQIQKENYFSAATNVAYLADPDFNGFIEYDKPDDGVPTTTGVEVFASGERNPFGICFHSNGYLYGTDNGPNDGYGDMKTGCSANEFIPDVETEDKINILRKGEYYGHPNPLRASAMNEPRQCKWRSPTDPSDAEYTAPLVIAPSSTGAIIEFESDHFGGQMRGNLIYAKYTSKLYRVILTPSGQAVIPQSDPPIGLVGAKGLGVAQAPDGSLLQAQYSVNQLWVHIPVEEATTEVKVNSVWPRRGHLAGGSTLTIYGKNLQKSGSATTVLVGSFGCPVQSVTATQITCTLPGGSGTVDITVSVGGESYIFKRGYRFISGFR